MPGSQSSFQLPHRGQATRLHEVRGPDKRAAAIAGWVTKLERGEAVY